MTFADLLQLQEVKPDLEAWRIARRLEEQDSGAAEFLVAETDAGLVSFVFLKYYGKPSHPEYPDLEDLYVKASERGRGHATALLEACEARARKRGYAKIGLAASPDRDDLGRRLYEKLGYRHDGGAPYVDGVYDGVNDWVVDMVKVLD